MWDFSEKEKSLQDLNENLRKKNNALQEQETLIKNEMVDLNRQIYHLNSERNNNNGMLQIESNSMNDLMTKITEKNCIFTIVQ